jgi:cell division protein FtsB
VNSHTVSEWPAAIRRILPVAVLLLALIAVPYLVFSDTGLARLEGLKAERDRLNDTVAGLQYEIRQLDRQVQRAKERPEDVERIARDELGLVRQTELVFQFSQ